SGGAVRHRGRDGGDRAGRRGSQDAAPGVPAEARPQGGGTALMDPKGHVAVVTGAACGLGAETAAQLAKAGARVALLDISTDAAQKMAAQVGGVAIRCDVADAGSAAAALAEAREKLGRPRILVNCAGIGPAKRIVGRDGPMPLPDFERVIAINLVGTFNMMRLTSPPLATHSTA